MKHLFTDVRIFDDGHGYCHICRCDRAVDQHTCGIDILEAGPSCRDISRLNHARKEHAGCYGDAQESKGTSGLTYQLGFRKAWLSIQYIQRCSSLYIYIYTSRKIMDHSTHACADCCSLINHGTKASELRMLFACYVFCETPAFHPWRGN